MAKTYGQLADGITDYKDFEKKIAEQMKPYLLLNWQTKKTVSIVKKSYKQGLNIADTVSLIILNS